jgi:ankyrin repeat protein
LLLIYRLTYGRFRWAACQLDALAKCRNRARLRKSLATLPSTLDDTYERILCSISEEDVEYAIRILRWLSFSARPLLPEEVAQAVAIDPERHAPVDMDEVLEDPSDVLDICSSLVILTTISPTEIWGDGGVDRPEYQALVLAHYSVQEYLTSERCLQGRMARFGATPAACHRYIASSCLSYLRLLDDADYFSAHNLEDGMFGLYAARFWIHHTLKTTRDESLTQGTISLMSPSNAAYYNWIRLHDPENEEKGPEVNRKSESIPHPLYYSSLVGFTDVTLQLTANSNVDINTTGGRFGSALGAASAKGQIETVEILLVNGAKIDSSQKSFDNVLRLASAGGHDKIVSILIANGADVNAQGLHFDSALHTASAFGHDTIVSTLLANGADVNAQGGPDGSVLQAASASGHNKIVSMLLANGADVNAQGGPYGNALQAASARGYDKIVSILLVNGADVNAQGGPYGNALQAASASGNDKIVSALLANGANVNAQGGLYGNALQAASYYGFHKIVSILLTHNGDANATGGLYGNALMAASEIGHHKVIKLLLKSANLLSNPKAFGTILQVACMRGDKKFVRSLLANGVDVNLYVQFWTSLSMICTKGDTEICQLLLEYGADPNATSFTFWTPLQLALVRGYIDLLKILLSKHDRKSENTPNEWPVPMDSTTALSQAIEIAMANPNQPSGWSLMHWACRLADSSFVRLLLNHGLKYEITITTEPPGLWTPYAIAVYHNNEDLLKDIPHELRELEEMNLKKFNETISTERGSRHDGCYCDGCLCVSVLFPVF